MILCPPSETLSRLLAGELAGPAANEVRRHLDHCPQCQSELDQLSDDTELRHWMDRAQKLAPEPTEAAGLARMLEVLQATTDLSSGRRAAGPAGPLTFLAPPQRADELGQLGCYRIQAELGRGGMGIVLRAWDPDLARTVAVKVLRPELTDEASRARFVHEAQAAARVTHDHIVHIHAVVNPPDGPPYLVMEYVAGPTLADMIHQSGPVEPQSAAALVAQVADGLSAAHAAGLIHRDIKPANILLQKAEGRRQ